MDKLPGGSFGFNVNQSSKQRSPQQAALFQNRNFRKTRSVIGTDSDSDATIVDEEPSPTPRGKIEAPAEDLNNLENLDSRPSTASSLWDAASTSSLSWAEDEIENQSTREVQRLLDQIDAIVFEGVKAAPYYKLDLDECHEWRNLYLQLRERGVCPTIRKKLTRPKVPPQRLSVLPVQRQVQSAIITQNFSRNPQRDKELPRVKTCYNGSDRPATAHYKPLEETFHAMTLSSPKLYTTSTRLGIRKYPVLPPRAKLNNSWLQSDRNQNQLSFQLPPIESSTSTANPAPLTVPQAQRRLQSAQPARLRPPSSTFRSNPHFLPKFAPNLTSLRECHRKPSGLPMEEVKPEFFMNVVGKAVHREVRTRRPSTIRSAIQR